MQSRTNHDLFAKLSRSPREFPLHTTLKKAAGLPLLGGLRYAIACGVRKPFRALVGWATPASSRGGHWRDLCCFQRGMGLNEPFRALVESCAAIQAKVIAAKATHEQAFKPDQSNGAGHITDFRNIA